MTLKVKLSVSFIFLLFCLMLVSLTSIDGSIRINRRTQSLNSEVFDELIILKSFQFHIIQIQQFYTDAALTGNKDSLTEARNHQTGAIDDLKKLEETFSDRPVILDQLKEVQNKLMAYCQDGKTMADAYAASLSGVEYYMTEFDKSASNLTYYLDRIVDLNKNSVKNDFNTMLSVQKRLYYLSIIISIAAIISGIVLILKLRASLDRQVSRLTKLSDHFSRGDLTRTWNINGKDEFSLIANRTGQSIDRIREIVIGLKSSSGISSEISGNLSRELELMLVEVDEIFSGIQLLQKNSATRTDSILSSFSSIDQFFSGMENIAGQLGNHAMAVEETSAAVEEMNANIQNLAKIAKRKENATGVLQDVAELAGNKVDETAAIIGEISSEVDAIIQVIEIIDDIVARTNLLSMNAAIEAAHAGDAGRGFAIVASEMRNLAVSAGENAKTISNTLELVIGNIRKSIEASNESGSAFRQIEGEIREFVHVFGEISGNTQELSIGSEEILQATHTLQEVTDEIKLSYDEMENGTREISRSLREIEKSSTESLDRVNVINTLSSNIHKRIFRVCRLVIENNKSVSSVDDKVRYFLTENAGDSEERSNTGDFPMIRLMHLEFMGKAADHLRGLNVMNSNELSSHEQCQLGMWLYGKGMKNFGHLDEIAWLEDGHRELHESLKGIAEMDHQNLDDSDREEILEGFKADSKKVLSLLSEIESKVSAV